MEKSSKAKAEAKIEDVSFKDALGERYLAYALSTITARSLPDVRDGLKPVHRRLLYAMLQLRLDPKSGFKKCARVVGDVIGKYHPHGDSAVYDTMVRLAQSFALRYPLVEGQGNFGSIDGDNAAAMRYTEARLTDVAMALMEDISQDTVDFRATYDGEDNEPVVMPAGFPNLLANGSEGIAVGMATAIPPHNILELCSALVHLIKYPNASVETLCKHVTGPDFPTGGVVVESSSVIQKAYETGRGGMRVRARWEKEELSHGLYQVVITEIPYQVQKSRLIEKMAELFREKKLPLLGGIRDESTEDIRLILEPKSRTVDPEMLMAMLFKATDLEVRYSMNLNVLAAGNVPRVMSLKDALQSFIDHRHEVLIRKSRFRLDQIARRMEILEALLACYANLDEVIRIIREEDEPKPVLMEFLELNEVQVDAILNMRLRQLRKLEEKLLKQEYSALKKERKELNTLLKDEGLRMQTLSEQVKALKKRFAGDKALSARRTEIADAPDLADVDVSALIEKEPVTIVCSKLGWVRAFKGHHETLDAKFKEGDEAAFEVPAQTTDKLLVFASDGRFYTIPCDKLPSAKGHGEPIRLMIDLENNHDIIAMFIYQPHARYAVVASNGKGFVVNADDLLAQTRNGKQVLSLADKVTARACVAINEGDDHIAVIGTNRKMLVFPIDQLPSMKRGQGVALQKYKGASFSDAKAFAIAEGLNWKSGERTRQEDDMKPWLSNRATQGKLPPTGFPRSNRFQ